MEAQQDPQEGAQQEAEQIAQYPGSPFEDKNGNLWFSAVGRGVLLFDGKEFTQLSVKDGLGGEIVREILETEDGNLWFGTSGGLTRFDGEKFTVMKEYADPALTQTGPGFTGHGFHRDLWDTHIDREGTIWIATMDGVFRLEGEVFQRFPIPALANSDVFEFTSRMVYTIYEDVDGSLWFGTDGDGAVHFDGEKQTVYTTEQGLCGNHVSAILRDQRGDLWFGTSGGGVSRLHDGKFTTHFRYDTYQDHGVGWGRFLSLFEDRHGHVWFSVSGPGGGAHRFDGENFRYFSTEDGLGEGGAYSFSEDRDGILWIGTTSGSFWYEEGRFHNFTKDGNRSIQKEDQQ